MFVFNGFAHDSRVLKEAATLAEAGWEVRVIAHSDARLPRREHVEGFVVQRVEHVPFPARIVRRYLGDGYHGAGTPGSHEAKRARGQTRAFNPEWLVRRIYESWAYATYYAGALRLTLGTHRTVVCAHDLDTLPVAGAAALLSRRRLVYDSHELFLEVAHTPPRTAAGLVKWRWIEKHLSRRADLVTTVNLSIAEELQRRYQLSRQPTVIRNVPLSMPGDRTLHSWRAALGIRDGQRVVLFVGGIQAGRGLETLVRACATVPDVSLALIGPADPGEMGRLKTLAAKLNVELHVLPPVPSEQVAPYASQADVGVVPYQPTSLNNWYSLPTKLFEYLMAGLPVVAGEFPELTRLIRQHDVGELCDPQNPDSVAHALRMVLDDPERLAELRTNAVAAGRTLTWAYESKVLLGAWGAILTA